MTPPTAMRSQARCAIGLDIGGTKIAGGVVDANGGLVERMPPIPSPATDSKATLVALQNAVAHLRARRPDIEAVGVGAAGMVNWPEGYIRYAPNSPYNALPLRQLLQDATNLRTVVDNDANVAGYAENRLGNQASHMAFLTVGTGVGGGLILTGQVYRGRTGIGAEVGHIVVDPDSDQQCGCGNFGCLEALASGTALGRYGREAAAADPNGPLATLAGGAANVTGEIVLKAARLSDPAALACFQRVGRYLGIGLATLDTVFEFGLIVIGGGVAAAGDLLLSPTRASFNERVFAPERRELPDIVPAHLGADAGWIGAAILALDQSHTPSLPASDLATTDHHSQVALRPGKAILQTHTSPA